MRAFDEGSWKMKLATPAGVANFYSEVFQPARTGRSRQFEVYLNGVRRPDRDK